MNQKGLIIKSIIFLFLLVNISNLFGQNQFDTLFIREVGKGVHHFYVEEKNVPWTLNVLKIDLKQTDLKIESVMANDVIAGLERTSSMSARYDEDSHYMIGGINADFFDYSGLPVGAQVREGELITSPYPRSAIGLDDSYNPFINVLSLQSQLITKNGSRTINGINRIRDADHLTFYNSYFGNSTGTNIYGSEVSIRPISEWRVNDSVFCVVTNKTSGVGNNTITEGNAVLSGHGSSKTFIDENIEVEDTIIIYHKLHNALDKTITTVGGFPKIVTDGENCALDCYAEEGGSNNFATARHPRTAAGYSENGNYLYLITVDGRQTISKGMSLPELADFMVGIGVHRGLNLDGGGSTTMVVRNQVANSPSDAGGERSVSNALFVVSTAPKGDLSQIRLNTEFAKVFSDSTYQFSTGGFDDNFNSIPINSGEVTYSVINDIGTISTDGIFRAGSESDTGFVIAEYQGLFDTSLVVVNSIVRIELAPQTSVTDTSTSINFEVKSFDLNGYEIKLKNSQYYWQVTDESIGSIDSAGIFNGFKTGETKVIATFGTVSDTASVKIELGSGVQLLDSFENLEGWSLTGENIDTSTSSIIHDSGNSTNGSYSLGLNYSFTYQNGVINWAYLNKIFQIFGIPENISIDILSDDKKHTAAFIVSNNNEEEFALLMNKPIDSSEKFDTLFSDFEDPVILTENAVFHFPLTIIKIAFILGSDREAGTIYNGKITIDNLRLVYPDAIVSVYENESLPNEFELYQNYPNPFNPTTTIEYKIPNETSNGDAKVSLKIFDVLGREVSVLVNQIQASGFYSVKFDASNLSSGTYYYQLISGNQIQTNKMMLLK